MTKFQLQSDFSPAWDQPDAIQGILDSFDRGEKSATLLGATGTWKTFTMANVIQKIQKPTLIISHNKTLAAQLATEFKHFFPNNAVHYFVSYFDYYQPESYLPAQGLYIEKEATVNQEIEMYRLATMASLLSREDVIVVASVSSLYGLWQKRFFQENCLQMQIDKEYSFKDIKSQLLHMQYNPVQSKIEHGMFDFNGDVLDIFSSTEKYMYRLHFDEEKLDIIELRDSTTFEFKWKIKKITLWPATQFLQNMEDVETILSSMENELKQRVKYFKSQKMLVEAERIQKRVMYDIRMIRETWFTNGIENYSLYFDRRKTGEAPNTLFDYFPDDMLMILDESHMTVPQLQAMPKADMSRKTNLINHWFRLPSASDHRPLGFEELEVILGLKKLQELKDKEDKLISDPEKQKNQLKLIQSKIKKKAKTLFASATPAQYETNLAQTIVEQVIRPTGLLDPITYVYPKSGDEQLLLDSVEKLIQKKPHLKHFFQQYHHDDEDFNDLF